MGSQISAARNEYSILQYPHPDPQAPLRVVDGSTAGSPLPAAASRRSLACHDATGIMIFSLRSKPAAHPARRAIRIWITPTPNLAGASHGSRPSFGPPQGGGGLSRAAVQCQISTILAEAAADGVSPPP